MLLAIILAIIGAGAATYFLHPAYFTAKNIKAEVAKIEGEFTAEFAKAEAAAKVGITAAQAEAKAVVVRIKALL